MLSVSPRRFDRSDGRLLPSCYRGSCRRCFALSWALRADEGEELFEKSIRPLLASRCYQCHGPKKQWAELRLDSPAALTKGGESGPAVVAGKPAESELVARVSAPGRFADAPPESGKALTAVEVRALTRWIELGAPWPAAPPAPLPTPMRSGETIGRLARWCAPTFRGPADALERERD